VDGSSGEEEESEPLPPLSQPDVDTLDHALDIGYYKFKSVMLHIAGSWKDGVICMKPPVIKVSRVVWFAAGIQRT